MFKPFTALSDLKQRFIKLPSVERKAAQSEFRQIDVQELECLLRSAQPIVLIDVRTPAEYAIAHLPGAVLVPFPDIQQGKGIAQIKALLEDWQSHHPGQDCSLLVYCTAGIRSAKALLLLQQAGILGINVQGGLQAWHQVPEFRPILQSFDPLENALMKDSQLKPVLRPNRKWMAGLGAMAAVGLIGWASYKVVHNPDKLRPLIQAGVPLHLAAGVPVLGDAVLAAEVPQVTVEQLKQMIDRQQTDYVLVDVRASKEYTAAQIPGAVSIPLSEIESGSGVEKIRSILKGRQLIVYCTAGYRSGKAAVLLHKAGIHASQVIGGVHAWREKIDASMPLS